MTEVFPGSSKEKKKIMGALTIHLTEFGNRGQTDFNRLHYCFGVSHSEAPRPHACLGRIVLTILCEHASLFPLRRFPCLELMFFSCLLILECRAKASPLARHGIIYL